jgi:hypothetical protein
MPEQQTATLAAVFSDVLASLAFMFTDGRPAEVPTEGRWLESAIGYRGPMTGELRLRCTRGFAARLAASLLGIDPNDADADARADDAVKEFMNIVCGQFVTTVYGAEDIFSLAFPELRELETAPDLEAEDGDDCTTLCVEGHPVQLACIVGS